MTIISKILGILQIESGLIRGLCLGLIILYEPILVVFGGTVGQKIMGLRVIKNSTYMAKKSLHNINIIESLIRYAMKILLGWISLLTIHGDIYGRAIHDKVGNSIMAFK